MPVQSTEAQLAVMDQKLRQVVEALGELKGLGLTVHDLASKVASLDERLTKQAPTIDEFITIKHKVVGAGMLGRGLWIFGAFLLGLVSSGRLAILAHMPGSK